MPVTRRSLVFTAFILGQISLTISAVRPDNDVNSHSKVVEDVSRKKYTEVNDIVVVSQKSAPKFSHPSKMIAKEIRPAGNSFKLRCKAEGYPTPNITWFKNNGTMRRSYLKPSYGRWLMSLDELTKSDDGNYTCLVCNELGCIDHTVELKVIERYPARPYMKEGYPENITALLHATAQFSCPVVSDLEPYVYWTWKASNTTEEVEVKSEDSNDEADKLTIYNVTARAEGWYKCIAINTLGINSARGFLRVISNINSIVGTNVPTMLLLLLINLRINVDFLIN